MNEQGINNNQEIALASTIARNKLIVLDSEGTTYWGVLRLLCDDIRTLIPISDNYHS